jgi:hypothetical protein
MYLPFGVEIKTGKGSRWEGPAACSSVQAFPISTGHAIFRGGCPPADCGYKSRCRGGRCDLSRSRQWPSRQLCALRVVGAGFVGLHDGSSLPMQELEHLRFVASHPFASRKRMDGARSFFSDDCSPIPIPCSTPETRGRTDFRCEAIRGWSRRRSSGLLRA